jgi:hypothetical protein
MSDRFITEIPLKATPTQESVLNKRFEAARQVYNACLGESLRRLKLMRESKDWQKARLLPKGKERTAEFVRLNKEFGFREYDIHFFAKQFGYSWLGYHLDSQTIKKLASRAFTWVSEYLFDPKRGRPKFKRFGQLNSVEGVTNLQGIIWRDDCVVWNSGRNGKKIKLEAIIDYDDPIMSHGLNSEIKFVRLIRRELNGKTRFFAQLVNVGKPYKRHSLGKGVVGLDIGPSTVAVVSQDMAFLKQFCAELEDIQRDIRLLQRKVDRQRRANNPDNYNTDGTVKPRSQLKRWVKSNRQLKTEIKLSELKRKQAEYRKSLHGQLINQILQMGNVIRLEKLSYVAFQKMFGKSVGMRAPGMFVARLKQKMDDYDGLVEEFSTYSTKLSQLDHKTGEFKKKSLSQRWHKFDDGEVVQRDLYSAFLATCIEDGTFNAVVANEQWPRVGPLLQAALDDIDQNGPTSFGL